MGLGMDRKMGHRLFAAVLAAFFLFLVSACGGGGGSTSSGSSVGTASISVTDAPGNFDHVYITLTSVWVHASADADATNTAGWQKFPLSSPVTIDLTQLENGQLEKVWSAFSLPAGSYQQIRFFVAPTEDALTASAQALGLKYNNEVVDQTGAFYPLRIVAPASGIKLIGTFTMAAGGTLDLGVDFDALHDVVQITAFGAGTTEYMLKPRLTYFDLDSAGAVTGSITNGAALDANDHFVIKAEQLNSDGTYHVVRRWTGVDKNGDFTLYPLAPGTYDVVIRGLDTETMIIRNVPVIKGTTPTSSPTNIGAVTTVAGTDYNASGQVKPTGAWVQFYQTPSASDVPYEIRYRHFDPLAGQFADFALSNSPMWVGSYNGNAPVSFSQATPVEGTGVYKAYATAELYDRSAAVIVNGTDAASLDFGTLAITAPAVAHQVSGTFSMAGNAGPFNSGYVIATYGGTIVNAVSPAPIQNNSSYVIGDLPGGVPKAFYGIEAWAWNSNSFAIGRPRVANLTNGDDTVNIQMKTFTP
ncbi:MAG: DUF4382 domain-containing protein [Nitrospiraceae bacterium]|nr:DUF4382 domain-containing protein [Nitrospiraceae bacterium]